MVRRLLRIGQVRAGYTPARTARLLRPLSFHHRPLHLGRTKRIASPGQRLVLHARDRGCTFPGCAIPGYLCQTHHAETDYGAGGHTDITNLGLACGPHNRLVTERGWTTRIRADGRVEWIPPPLLDTRQPRVNALHHPEDLFHGFHGDGDGDDR